MCPTFEAHLWSRLRIIAYEDVSALVPGNIPTRISQMREDYFYFRGNGNDAALLVIANAVMLLCRSPKSRTANHLVISMKKRLDEGLRLEVPDYAYDMHTKKGRDIGRGGKHFVEEAVKLQPEADFEDLYREEVEKLLKQGKYKLESLKWAGEKRRKREQKKKIEKQKEKANKETKK